MDFLEKRIFSFLNRKKKKFHNEVSFLVTDIYKQKEKKKTQTNNKEKNRNKTKIKPTPPPPSKYPKVFKVVAVGLQNIS